MGLLCEGEPPEWHPAQQEIKDASKLAAKFCKVTVTEKGLFIYYSLRDMQSLWDCFGIYSAIRSIFSDDASFPIPPQDAGSDLARLAVQFSASTEGVATHLMGCNDSRIFRRNLEAILTPPTAHEIALSQQVREK